MKFGNGWADTAITLPSELSGPFRDLFTGKEVRAKLVDGEPRLCNGEILNRFPVSLLN